MTFQKGHHEATGNLQILRNSKRTIDAFRNELFVERCGRAEGAWWSGFSHPQNGCRYSAVSGLAARFVSTHGTKSFLKNSASEGEGVFSRMPTRPFARAVLWADSIVRAVLAFLCFVDSRTTSLFHKHRRIASIQKKKIGDVRNQVPQ
jgi:hypothetical protein